MKREYDPANINMSYKSCRPYDRLVGLSGALPLAWTDQLLEESNSQAIEFCNFMSMYLIKNSLNIRFSSSKSVKVLSQAISPYKYVKDGRLFFLENKNPCRLGESKMGSFLLGNRILIVKKGSFSASLFQIGTKIGSKL